MDNVRNEIQHSLNGERQIITVKQLKNYIDGNLSANDYQNELEEMLLDILNKQYDVDDAVASIIEFCDFCEEVDEKTPKS